jgi:hypothetical protein
MNNILSGTAVALSTLACLLGGFAAYKVFSLEQDVRTSSLAIANLEKVQTSSIQERADASVTDNESSQPANSGGVSAPTNAPPPTNNTGIQPGQFIQPTLGNLGRIELLAAKRIQDPQTGNRDVVNVMFRVYRVAENPGPTSLITYWETTARNPDTSETYKVHRDSNRDRKTTGNTLLMLVKKDIPEDGYVWLKVPEGVDKLDIYIPKTQVFKNVPITS